MTCTCRPGVRCIPCALAADRTRLQLINDLRDGANTPAEFTARFLDAGRWANPGDAQVAAEGARY